MFASAVARIYAWYGFGRRLSLLEINTNGKDKKYRAVVSLDQNLTSGLIMMIGLISKEVSICIPVTQVQEKFARVGGIILVPVSEIGSEINQKFFSML